MSDFHRLNQFGNNHYANSNIEGDDDDYDTEILLCPTTVRRKARRDHFILDFENEIDASADFIIDGSINSSSSSSLEDPNSECSFRQKSKPFQSPDLTTIFHHREENENERLDTPIPEGVCIVEIFFGDYENIDLIAEALANDELSSTGHVYVDDVTGVRHYNLASQFTPENIEKLRMVTIPLTSFDGINQFTNVVEVCIGNCTTKQAKWSDFDELIHLEILNLYNCGLEKVETFQFKKLKTLCLSGNKLTSINFLGQGIPTLEELNVAQNEITCLREDNLVKCTALHTLNLSGNPICTVQDVDAIRVLPNLTRLFLADQMYDKCPLASLCDSRPMLLSILTNLRTLDGQEVSDSELLRIQNYIFTRSLFYFATTIKTTCFHAVRRKGAINKTNKILEKNGYRILQLIGLDARFKRVLAMVEILPLFTNVKNIMKDHTNKIQKRISNLQDMTKLSLKRLEVMMQISRWEQETEKWLKWIEFQTYGNVQCCMIQSVHGELYPAESHPPHGLKETLHKLLSSMACAKLWPATTLVKIESVFVLSDKGMDVGLQRTYEMYFQQDTTPPFMPPPEDMTVSPALSMLDVTWQEETEVESSNDATADDVINNNIEFVDDDSCSLDNFVDDDSCSLDNFVDDDSCSLDNFVDDDSCSLDNFVDDFDDFGEPSLANRPSYLDNFDPIDSDDDYYQTRSSFPPFRSNRDIETFTCPDYESPFPAHPFPDSVPGLPERAYPIYLFLICPQKSTVNPLVFLHRVMNERSKHYKDLRLTNCLWLANPLRTQEFSVVIIVRAIRDALQTVSFDKCGCKHDSDCCSFSLKKPYSISPAYIVTISFTKQDKQTLKLKLPESDDDIINPAEAAISGLSSKISSRDTTLAVGAYTQSTWSKKSPYLNKTSGGLHGELCTMHVSVTLDGLPLNENNPNAPISFMSPNGFEHNITKFLGPSAEQHLTSLNLSGNKIGLIVGLKGLKLNSLKCLNLSHNNLTTLTGLEKLPNLIEFKVGWNSLRFLLSCVSTLVSTTPKLLTLEILPNPLQDVHDFTHIPMIIARALKMIHRIDIWTSPFLLKSQDSSLNPPPIADAGFSHIALAKSWDGTPYSYNDLGNQCLRDLSTLMPKSPPCTEAEINGIDLNLSNNYLNSIHLASSHLVKSLEWKNCLIKLQLQENTLEDLDWMKNKCFPNLQILNLSNNLLRDFDIIPESCPNIGHLYLCENPLPSDINVLEPLKQLRYLATFDCSECPLTYHPGYGPYVLANVATIEVLNGFPKVEWELFNSIRKSNGILTQDWLWLNSNPSPETATNNLSNLQLPNCCIQKIDLPYDVVPDLMTINLDHNRISTLSSLSLMLSLRVLSMSYNNVNTLGASPCTVCYSKTAESQAAFRNAKLLEIKNNTQEGFVGCNLKLDNTGDTLANQDFYSESFEDNGYEYGSDEYDYGNDSGDDYEYEHESDREVYACREHPEAIDDKYYCTEQEPVQELTEADGPVPFIFPNLEGFVLSHNGLSGLKDLHLHAMPTIKTLIISCNNLVNLRGLEFIPTLQALVLDNNHIRDIPHNCFMGCKSLKYLHLEHNRLTSFPRLPHLTNLTGLFLAYNKIQSLTDLEGLTKGPEITECTLNGNRIATRSDYRLCIAATVPRLNMLDGKDLATEKLKLQYLRKYLFTPVPTLSDPGIRLFTPFPSPGSQVNSEETNIINDGDVDGASCEKDHERPCTPGQIESSGDQL